VIGAAEIRPYDLHFRLHSGEPIPETEPNTTTPQPLPPSGFVSGVSTSSADRDRFSIDLNAGDTLFASLDLDPGRNGTDLGVGLEIGPFDGTVLGVNDALEAGPDSVAHFVTVKEAGTYVVTMTGITGGDYRLSVSVLPGVAETPNCTTYTSMDVPKTLASNVRSTSTLTVPGNPRIADLDVSLQLNHPRPQDLDIHLRSPAGNDNAIVISVGSFPFPNWNFTIDDEAAFPLGSFNPTFNPMSGFIAQPNQAKRLAWFDGENAGGDWTLVFDDRPSANGPGTLQSWSLRICEPPPTACPPGGILTPVFSTDFEANDAGFTHSGTNDQWARGLPSGAHRELQQRHGVLRNESHWSLCRELVTRLEVAAHRPHECCRSGTPLVGHEVSDGQRDGRPRLGSDSRGRWGEPEAALRVPRRNDGAGGGWKLRFHRGKRRVGHPLRRRELLRGEKRRARVPPRQRGDGDDELGRARDRRRIDHGVPAVRQRRRGDRRAMRRWQHRGG
jgi:subtilisin-like proprotein convertase family protein